MREVPQPRKPDDTAYINSLEGRDKEIFKIYEEISESSNESKLIDVVTSGLIGPNDTNREGQTPLMFAVDSNFSTKAIEKLIELGCDVNAQGEDGMTPLHKSIWCENKENFKKLLSKGADLDIKDEEGESCRDLVDDNPSFKTAIEDVFGPDLAKSMSKSQVENSEMNVSQQ